MERAWPSNRISQKQAKGVLLDRPTDLEAQIATLKSADLATLRLRWRATFRKAFPEHLPPSLVIGILAYRLQADA